MKIEYNQKYDLHTLLRLKNLEILKVANDNPSMLVGEYFDCVYF